MKYSENPNDWFSTEMVYDQEYRFSHGEGCRKKGESPDIRGRLYVVRRGDGWAWSCHNCGQAGFKKARVLDRIRYAEANKNDAASKLGTPRGDETHAVSSIDITQDLQSINSSSAACEWLSKYDITPNEIKRFCTAVKCNRLGLIIYDQDSVIQGVQLRNLKNDNKPKYITKYIGDYKLGSWFNSHAKTLVIVEDILSGIKVSRNPEYAVLALLGSPAKLPQKIIDKILKYDKIVVWLDFDKALTALHYQARMRLLYGLRIYVITTQADPKTYTNHNIKQLIEENINGARNLEGFHRNTN
jgi:hypothetical protein